MYISRVPAKVICFELYAVYIFKSFIVRQAFCIDIAEPSLKRTHQNAFHHIDINPVCLQGNVATVNSFPNDKF